MDLPLKSMLEGHEAATAAVMGWPGMQMWRRKLVGTAPASSLINPPTEPSCILAANCPPVGKRQNVRAGTWQA